MLLKRYARSISVLLLIFLLLSSIGCGTSKAGYRDQMKRILNETAGKLNANFTELQKVSGKPKEIEKKGKKLEQEQLEILKETKDKIDAINPPDDLFSGHANLVEFLDLFIKYREKQSETGKKPTTEQFGEQPFELFQAATSAFSRAGNDLSFLQYELRKAFYNLLTSERPEQRMIRPGSPIRPGPTPIPGQVPTTPGR